MKENILCIEDDPTIQILVQESLKDYHVIVAKSLTEAAKDLRETELDLILCDIELPDGDGLKFLTTLSNAMDEKLKKCSVMILTGHTDITNKLMAFSIGVDDFISKPFDPMELTARVGAKLKKRKQDKNNRGHVRVIGNVELDFDRHRAIAVKHGKETVIPLTATELKILHLLTTKLGHVYPKEQVLQEIWGDTFVSDTSMDCQIFELRQKLQNTRLSLDSVLRFGYKAFIEKIEPPPNPRAIPR